MKDLGLALALLAASSSCAASAAESAAAPIKIGPLVFGDDIPATMAALPGADWKVEYKSEFSGRPMAIRAGDAFEFGGRRVNIEVSQRYYDWHVELTASAPVSAAAECEQFGISWLKAVEGGAGPFRDEDTFGGYESAPVATWRVTLAGDGGFAVTPIAGARGAKNAREDWLSLSDGSFARYSATTKDGAFIARKNLSRTAPDGFSISAKRNGPKYEVKASAGMSFLSPGSCEFNALYLGWKERPPIETVAFDSLRIIGVMKAGDRHRLLKAAALTSGVTNVTQKCTVSRQTGRVLVCHGPESSSVDPTVENLAGRLAGAVVFDTSRFDRDDPQELAVEIPVRVDPADLENEDFAALPRVLMSDVAFLETPPAKEFGYAFPVRAKQRGVTANAVSTCQVQKDGSLICLSPRIEQSDGLQDLAAEFSRGVERLIPLYLASPKLKNGMPSAGAVFDIGVVFAIE